jgi:phosphatidylglycerophosphatase A
MSLEPERDYSAVERVAIQLATCFGIGNAPVAPGTVASVPGLVAGVALAALTAKIWREPTAQFSAVTVFLLAGTALSYWCIHVAEKAWNTHDESRIVADEVIGQAIAVAYVDPSWKAALVAFALFRLLDITKPLLIGWIDESGPGALGTLGDDLLAGLVTALVLGGLGLLAPGLFA